MEQAALMFPKKLFDPKPYTLNQAALMFRKKLFEMTKEYAETKMCWAPKGNQPLIKVHFSTFNPKP